MRVVVLLNFGTLPLSCQGAFCWIARQRLAQSKTTRPVSHALALVVIITDSGARPPPLPRPRSASHRVQAGKVELDGASYAGLPLPFTITQLIWIEVILVGGAEVYRNSELEPEKRCYPGGFFDPLKLASDGDEEKAFRLKTAEIKHARLAMVAFLGYSVQALSVGEGVLGSLAKFSDSISNN